jgi:hypothetical protein
MRMFDSNYIHPGFIFIPCFGMTPGGLRAQYLIPNLTPKCECLSIHSSLPLGPLHHAIPRNQRKQFLCQTEAKLPTASVSAESFEEILLRWTGFFYTKLGPQIRLPPVPILVLTGDSPASPQLALRPPRPLGRSRGWQCAALPTPVPRSCRPRAHLGLSGCVPQGGPQA